MAASAASAATSAPVATPTPPTIGDDQFLVLVANAMHLRSYMRSQTVKPELDAIYSWVARKLPENAIDVCSAAASPARDCTVCCFFTDMCGFLLIGANFESVGRAQAPAGLTCTGSRHAFAMIVRKKMQGDNPTTNLSGVVRIQQTTALLDKYCERWVASQANQPYRPPTPWAGRGETDTASQISSVVDAGLELRDNVRDLRRQNAEQLERQQTADAELRASIEDMQRTQRQQQTRTTDAISDMATQQANSMEAFAKRMETVMEQQLRRQADANQQSLRDHQRQQSLRDQQRETQQRETQRATQREPRDLLDDGERDPPHHADWVQGFQIVMHIH